MRLPRIITAKMGARSDVINPAHHHFGGGHIAVKMIRQAVGVRKYLGSQTGPVRQVRNYLQMRVGKG